MALLLAGKAPRLIVDPADSSLTAIPGAVTFSDPSRATNAKGENWHQAATARFVPVDPEDLDVYNQVLRFAFNNFPRRVLAEECDDFLRAQGAPLYGKKLVRQGGKRMLGLIANATRPKGILVALTSNSEHAAIFETPLAADRAYLAGNLGVPIDEFEAKHAQLQRWGFLWADRRARTLTVCAPLPLKSIPS